MRAFAAIGILVFSCCSRALQGEPTTSTTSFISRALYSTFGISKRDPVHRLLACGQTLGPAKCLDAFSVWRSQNAIETLEKNGKNSFNLTRDVTNFPWEKYVNNTHDHLYSQLCENTENLLQYRQLELTYIPGYKFQLSSKGNGKLSVDVYKSNENGTGRSTMKKLQKQFYNIVPILLLPGLIMSAILPFVLPALKMMTIGVGMLNNMALSGAIFTLMRNNAFHDRYDKKVLYVNSGYKNERLKHLHQDEDDNHESHYSNVHEEVSDGDHLDGNEYEIAGDYPTNLVKQYYEGYVKVKRNSERNRFNRG